MRKFASVFPALALVIAATWAAWAAWPAGGQPFPRAGTPSGPVVAFQYCFPTAVSPCISAAAAPASKAQPLSAAANFTVVTKITKAALTAFGSKTNYIVSLQELAGNSYHVDAAYIGQAVTSTSACTSGSVNSGKCNWDFTGITQLTSSAATAFTVPAGSSQLLLDTVAGTLVSGADYIVAIDITGGTTYPTVTPNTTTANTKPAACGTGSGCTYTSWATPTAGTSAITASISTTTMTVTVASGTNRIHLGSLITGSGVTANTIVTALGTGTGTTGTYTVSQSQSVGSEAMTAALAPSLGKANPTNTTTISANTAWFATAGIVAVLGTYSTQ